MSQNLLLTLGPLLLFVGAFALCLSVIGFTLIDPLRAVLAQGWLPALCVITLIFLTLVGFVAVDMLFVPLLGAMRTHHPQPVIAPLLWILVGASSSSVLVVWVLRRAIRMPAAESQRTFL